MPIRILLADDHDLVRAGLRALLQRLDDIEVVAEAADGRTAVQYVARYAPDVALMDISMPNLNGLEATARIVQTHPHTRVIIVSMHANDDYVLLALRKGAAGYLLKSARLPELEQAVRAVARGDMYLSPAVSRRIVGNLVQHSQIDVEAAAKELASADRLTPRQREVLQLIVEGYTLKQIAQELHISVKTVETHRAQLMDRLNIHDIASLVRYAIRVGLIAPTG